MNVVVTGGGTIAPIDDVRRITNTSSGGFAAALTEACLDAGAMVWHIHAPSAQLPLFRQATFDLDAPADGPELQRLTRLQRRYRACQERLVLLPLAEGTVHDYERTLRTVLQTHPIDIAFLAMAVSDYEPDPLAGKLDSKPDELVIRCRRTPKVIRSVRDWAPDVYLVGFKLLSRVSEERLIEVARVECATNRADLTVANDFETVRAGRHRVHLVRPENPVESLGPDEALAESVVERVFAWAREGIMSREPIGLDETES
jgi:phosphopantothenate-cysteine ligase